MRRFLLIILSTLMIATPTLARELIYFGSRKIDGTMTGNLPDKYPLAPPTVFLEDHTLYFETGHPSYDLTLLDEQGLEVYSVTVLTTESEHTLPSSLSGTFSLELTDGICTFTATIVI